MKLLNRLLGRTQRAPASGQPPTDVDALLRRYGSLAAIKLGNALTSNAARCAEAVDAHIQATGAEERHQQRALIICEFFYFFVHLANRRFYLDHGEAIGRAWQNELEPLIVEDFLDGLFDSFFTTRRDGKLRDFRDGMLAEMNQKVNNAEMDYAPCRGLLDEKKIFTGNALFTTLARNVAALAGTKNPIEQALIMDFAFDIFADMKLVPLVNEAAAKLRSRHAA